MNAVPAIQPLLIRDLETLRRELRAYSTKSEIWITPPGVSNSAGTLAMHLTGNISHFIGAVIGKDGYVRNRDAEFSVRDIDILELEKRIDVAIQSVEDGLSRITDFNLEKPSAYHRSILDSPGVTLRLPPWPDRLPSSDCNWQ